MRLLPFPTCAEYDFLGVILSGSEDRSMGQGGRIVKTSLRFRTTGNALGLHDLVMPSHARYGPFKVIYSYQCNLDDSRPPRN
jgi:hypothetical protein